MDLDDCESTAQSSTIQLGVTTVQSGASTVQSGASTIEPGASTVQPGVSTVQPGAGTTAAFPVLARTPNICALPTTYGSMLKKPTALGTFAGDVSRHDVVEAPSHEAGLTETKSAEFAVPHSSEVHRDRKRKKDKVLILVSSFHLNTCMSISLAYVWCSRKTSRMSLNTIPNKRTE